jgi:4'-phosphopantetheinyl transferase
MMHFPSNVSDRTITCFTPVAHLTHDAVDVFVTRLDVDIEVVQACASLLSDVELQRASRFAFARDRCRFIVGRARLRQLLGTRLGMRPQAVALAYGPHGKPALARHCAASNVRFNVAHAGDVAVYAFSHGREVGIDLEAIRAIPDADDIAAHFFSRREKAAYFALGPRDRLVGFFNCWTRKEAFVKALGGGLSYPLDRFDVSVSPREPAEIIRVDNTPGNRCGWRLESLFLGPGWASAVVVASTRCQADTTAPCGVQ